MKSVFPAFFLLRMVYMGFTFFPPGDCRACCRQLTTMMCKVCRLFINEMLSRCLLVFQESGFNCSSGLLENVLMFKFCLLLSCYGKLFACFQGNIQIFCRVLSLC